MRSIRKGLGAQLHRRQLASNRRKGLRNPSTNTEDCNFSPRGLAVRRSDGKIQERTGLIPDAVILRLGYRGRFWNINSP
jgi:hypothetical protein